MSTMLVALVGFGVLGMSADDAPPGLSDLVVKVEPTQLKTRAFSPLHVRVRVVPLEIVACSERHRKAIQQHKSAVRFVVEAECAIWGAASRSSFPLDALRAARRDTDDEDVLQVLRRAELYSLLAPAQEGETLDRKAADRAAEELSALAKKSNPVVREMIHVNLAAYYYRVGEAARGDTFRRGLPELGPDAFRLPPLRRVEGK